MKSSVKVSIPATTANMGPGFDCLGMALDLSNEIEMSLTHGGTSITVEGEGAEDIPKDESNIVWRAAERVFQEIGQENPGLSIKLVNRIPASRGLGSSAAAIVGGVVAANQLTGETLSQDQLLALATELEGHPDNVAPALLGGIVISVNTEGLVHYLRIEPPEDLTTVVAVPDFQLATKAAREVLPRTVDLKAAVFNLSRTALMVGALCQNRIDLLAVAGQDMLHQPYRAALIPGLQEVIKSSNEAGALCVTLSGAGPTVIALCKGYTDEIAKAMQQSFKNNGITCQVKVLKPSVAGTKIL